MPCAAVHVLVQPQQLENLMAELRDALQQSQKPQVEQEQEQHLSAASCSANEELFEAYCSTCVFSLSPAELCYSVTGRRVMKLLEKLSQALPHLFAVTIVTKRVSSMLNRICVNPPPPPPPSSCDKQCDDDDDEDQRGEHQQPEEEEEQEEDPVDVAARIVSNLAGEMTRHHAPHLFQFRCCCCSSSSPSPSVPVTAQRSESPPLVSFALDYGSTSFVTAETAGLLWPGATALASLLVDAAAAKNASCRCQTLPHSIVGRMMSRDIFPPVRPTTVVIEVGCGLGLVSSTIAALWNSTAAASSHMQVSDDDDDNSQQQQQHLHLLCTDLHESAARTAMKNASAAAAAAAATSTTKMSRRRSISVASSALDWKDLDACRQLLTTATAMVKGATEVVLVGSEVIYDEAMALDVARMTAAMMTMMGKDTAASSSGDDSPIAVTAAYYLIMNHRVGIDAFSKHCRDDLSLKCERFNCDEYSCRSNNNNNSNASSSVVEIIVKILGMEKRSNDQHDGVLKGWSLFRVSRD